MIFSQVQSWDGTNKNKLEIAITSFFNTLGFPNPNSALACLDETSATEMDQVYKQQLNEGCQLTLSKVKDLIDSSRNPDITWDTLLVTSCMDQTQDFIDFFEKFDDVNVATMFSYMLFSYRSIKAQICDIQEVYEQQKWEDVGRMTGEVILKIQKALE